MEVVEDQPRVISEKKILKNEEVHDKVIKTRTTKFTKQLCNDLKHNALIVGDSKVRHLEKQMTAKTNITAFWRSGAKLDNYSLKKHIDRHIARFNRPIVILVFNTCYLTTVTDKHAKYIDLVPNEDEIVNFVIEKYRDFKQQRLYNKPSARIVFIECPYYSIVDWNRCMKHPEPELFQNKQNKLEILIQELNVKIKELNLPLNPPQIAQDMIIKIKKKKNHKQTKRISYNVLKDGIHPGNDISELWLVRINNFISKLNN